MPFRIGVLDRAFKSKCKVGHWCTNSAVFTIKKLVKFSIMLCNTTNFLHQKRKFVKWLNLEKQIAIWQQNEQINSNHQSYT